MTDDIYELLLAIRGRGAFPKVHHGRLRIGRAQMITPKLWQEIESKESEIVRWLRQEKEVAGDEFIEIEKLMDRLADDRVRLVGLVLQQAARQNYPAVRLAPWARFQGGKEAWEHQVMNERTRPIDLYCLYEALLAEQVRLSRQVKHEKQS